MVAEFHVLNSSSFAVASWQTASGGAGAGLAAGDNTYTVEGGSVAVVNDLDHTGLLGGIEAFVVAEQRTGDIGAAGNPFRIDVDNSADAYFWHKGGAGCRVYYKAEGDTNLCNNYTHESAGASIFEGGTITNLYANAGSVTVGESTIVTNCDLYGTAAGTFEYNATGLTSLNIYGGGRSIILRREATIVVNAPITLTIDIDNETAPTMNLTVNNAGATVILKRCDTLATVDHQQGTVDLSKAERGINYGSTQHNRGPASVLIGFDDPRHTVAAATWPGQLRESGSPSPAPI